MTVSYCSSQPILLLYPFKYYEILPCVENKSLSDFHHPLVLGLVPRAMQMETVSESSLLKLHLQKSWQVFSMISLFLLVSHGFLNFHILITFLRAHSKSLSAAPKTQVPLLDDYLPEQDPCHSNNGAYIYFKHHYHGIHHTESESMETGACWWLG